MPNLVLTSAIKLCLHAVWLSYFIICLVIYKNTPCVQNCRILCVFPVKNYNFCENAYNCVELWWFQRYSFQKSPLQGLDTERSVYKTVGQCSQELGTPSSNQTFFWTNVWSEIPGCVEYIKCTGSIRRPYICRVFIESMEHKQYFVR
jgi:hypothetical protein